MSWGETVDDRPKSVGDCVGRPLPCPWVGCKHHTLIDVNEDTGTITINTGQVRGDVPEGSDHYRRRLGPLLSRGIRSWPIKEGKASNDARSTAIADALESMGEETCVLHMVKDNTSYTLEETGKILEVTRERVRQVEVMALIQLRRNPDEDPGIEEFREGVLKR